MKKYVLIAIGIFICGGLSGWISHYLYTNQTTAPDTLLHYQENYRYTNPIIDVELGQNRTMINTYADLKKEIEDYLSMEGIDPTHQDVAVYYQDLTTGGWFGINEKINFAPASLLKVPLMMGIYKMAESDPSILQLRVLYQGQYENEKNTEVEQETLISGQEYTVEQLIEKMIIYSDNVSRIVLIDLLLQEQYFAKFNNIAREMSIISPLEMGGDDTIIRVKDYSALFRNLYYSLYLEPQYSEKALQLLAQSSFDRGLRKKIPKKIEISHKFGFGGREDIQDQLHDCGIIYVPGRPYTLCVLTKNKNFYELEKIIQDISGIVYEYNQE